MRKAATFSLTNADAAPPLTAVLFSNSSRSVALTSESQLFFAPTSAASRSRGNRGPEKRYSSTSFSSSLKRPNSSDCSSFSRMASASTTSIFTPNGMIACRSRTDRSADVVFPPPRCSSRRLKKRQSPGSRSGQVRISASARCWTLTHNALLSPLTLISAPMFSCMASRSTAFHACDPGTNSVAPFSAVTFVSATPTCRLK
mmetsp:Transcript_14103/g.34965  ORF Transcript_14103/g.34965 Transcript_14103/m.34965 type:complete len:201 (+) Transcript_14103:38-640(+)